MLLSSFTGLAYVDIMLLHPHHIGTTADGRRYIRINRKKTNVEAFIPLHPIAALGWIVINLARKL